ncbi:Strongly-conserved Zn-finger binding protein (TFIIIA) [Tulasnella sp. 403]|nr:Strongly-conserved Zn-finger binding protein (TFIIIA) [Tulasnella sp. 403]
MRLHCKVKHKGQLNYHCPHEWCERRFGYKRNLQHHLRTCRPPSPDMSAVEKTSVIDQITGQEYVDKALAKPRVFTCPWNPTNNGEGEMCGHIFGRWYDLRRHMKAVHGIEAYSEVLQSFAAVEEE